MGYTSKFKGAEIDVRLEKMVNVTYAELVALRDEGKLIAGQMYRMTDYETTCTWENTQVAGHPFDLVLTALDNKNLDEKCSAIWSERDTDGYFANSNLAAWDVRYCLDNDTNRFDWALMGGKFLIAYDEWDEYEAVQDGIIEIDGVTYIKWSATNGWATLCTKTATPQYGEEIIVMEIGYEDEPWTAFVYGIEERAGGKGVIYRLIDEHNNDACYDFKNVMFLLPLTDGVFDANSSEYGFCYTFTRYNSDTSTMEDISNVLDGCRNNKIGHHSYYNVFFNYCTGNSIGDFCDSNILYNCLNNSFANMCCGNLLMPRSSDNTFGISCCNNTLEHDNSENVFGSYCEGNILSSRTSVIGKGNKFGIYCRKNFLGKHCSNNTFGDNCSSNTFGDNCSNNTFGSNCSNNTFGSNCEYNVFLTYCLNNIFGSSCQKNKFEAYCAYNTFDTSCSANVLFANCSRNTFGPTCNSNVLNVECSYNALSQYCSGNQLEIFCKNNTFGKYCLRNKLGSECSYNTFGSSSSNFYMSAVELKSKVQYVTFENSETSNKDIQFYTISNVAGTSSSRKSVTVQRNRTYQTYVTTKKDGTVVEYTVDDILNAQSNTPV